MCALFNKKSSKVCAFCIIGKSNPPPNKKRKGLAIKTLFPSPPPENGSFNHW